MIHDVIRRHYEYLAREHAKLSEEEAARTRVEGQNALYLADLASLFDLNRLKFDAADR